MLLRGHAGVLLAARTSLTRAALPLLAAYVPEAFCGASARARSLHVLARQPDYDYTKVEISDGADVGDLKKAVIAELKLDAAPRSSRV